MGVADLKPSLVMDDVSVTFRTFGGKRQIEGSRRPKWMAGHIGAVDFIPAVRNVSFVAHHGESIGLIGHNGSGKSTLMRAMAGLVPLVSGAVYTDGTASLLGVGGALMKDLTGESNIRLGCLALGLSPKQVEERFDSVVEFVDIGNSIRLPMRALSSGQAARLRFGISTAAHPDILLIDEALATGDAKFRKKSRERINEIRDTAGTVVLVSHSMSTIRQTCTRGLWMHRGQLRMDGPIAEVVDAYESSLG
jgi:teichoic acid transport system ATP-binding protein